jgi:Uncharacterized protein conserved in bacteria (DUF2147)
MLLASSLSLATVAVPSRGEITGFWQFPESGEIIRIQARGKRLCGRVAATASFDVKRRDERNPERRSRFRKICGLSLFSVKPSLTGIDYAGVTYSPEDGLDYQLRISVIAAGLSFTAYALPPAGPVTYDVSLQPKKYVLRRANDPGACQ